jgi:ribonucleoside-diphosphate reductase alpha chain
MSLIQPAWTEQREKVLMDRYALKDHEGKPLEKTWPEVAQRVANAVAQVEEESTREEYARQYFEAMKDFRVVPAGRILAGAGTDSDLIFYNCTVIPLESNDPVYGNDSRQGIMDTIAKIVEITSRGGGVGINWSVLRPKGAYVQKVHGRSSGSVSWMEAASAVAHQVEQGGSRRAALMFMLWDWHPDILEFINVKRDLTKIEHANLSVAISDSFMEAVEKDTDWVLRFPDTTHPRYNEFWTGNLAAWEEQGWPVIEYGLDDSGNVVQGGQPISARWLWDRITEAAHASGEPGVVFLERYNKQSNLAYREEIICVNPCGEQGLGPYGVCNLCSINLVAHLHDVGGKAEIDYPLLKESVRAAVRMSDNVIDINRYFMPQHEEVQRYGARRIGIGTMGLADMLILQEIRYGNDESLEIIDRVFSLIAQEAYRASIELAKERGSFPWFEKEPYLNSYFIKKMPQDIRDDIAQYGIRNSMLLTQAPTGTTSILAGVSSGIEPIFSFSYTREDRTGIHYVHHWLVERLGQSDSKGASAPSENQLPEWYVTALELTPEEHVRVQATIQKYVDSSISKTVNAPNSHTPAEVDELFRLAYETGCKGIAYFRTGSRKGVLTAAEQPAPQESDVINVPFGQLRPIKRPERLEGPTVKLKTPMGTLLLTLNYLEGRPIELLGTIGKAGSDVYAFTEAIARLISIALRCGVDPQVIADQLKGIGGSSTIGFGQNQITSVADAIGKFIEKTIAQNGGPVNTGKKRNLFKLCPECGKALLIESEGCLLCMGCGYSAC